MRDDAQAEPQLLVFDGVIVSAGGAAILDVPLLQVGPGAPTAIIGPNGSGKTTLLRAATGLVEVAAGRVISRAPSVAIVFQRPVMMRRSVADNVVFALDAARQSSGRADVEALLEQVGLAELADRPARRLSGGEQQRLGIARALARRPQLLLLDEATASLDPAQTKTIEDLIQRIALQGVKVVFATHDLGQARRLSGDIVFLIKGRVVEYARTETFFARPTTDAARQFVAGDLVL